MKAFATLAMAALLLGAGVLGNPASAQQAHRSTARAHVITLWEARAAFFAFAAAQSRGSQEQTGPVATGTVVVPTTTPTAAPTATISPYPDGQPILRSTLDVYGRLARAHYVYAITGDQTNVEQLRVNAAGDATCKGPALTARVVGKDVLQAKVEAQTKSVNEQFIVIKKKAFKKGKDTNNKWKQVKVSQVNAFGFTIDQPLACPAAGSSSGSGATSTGSVSLKDVVNLGPETFNGAAAWHVRATEVFTDATGAEQTEQIDFVVSQKGSLPYVFTFTQSDPAQHIVLVQKQTLTKFNKPVSIVAPKVKL